MDYYQQQQQQQQQWAAYYAQQQASGGAEAVPAAASTAEQQQQWAAYYAQQQHTTEAHTAYYAQQQQQQQAAAYQKQQAEQAAYAAYVKQQQEQVAAYQKQQEEQQAAAAVYAQQQAAALAAAQQQAAASYARQQAAYAAQQQAQAAAAAALFQQQQTQAAALAAAQQQANDAAAAAAAQEAKTAAAQQQAKDAIAAAAKQKAAQDASVAILAATSQDSPHIQKNERAMSMTLPSIESLTISQGLRQQPNTPTLAHRPMSTLQHTTSNPQLVTQPHPCILIPRPSPLAVAQPTPLLAGGEPSVILTRPNQVLPPAPPLPPQPLPVLQDQIISPLVLVPAPVEPLQPPEPVLPLGIGSGMRIIPGCFEELKPFERISSVYVAQQTEKSEILSMGTLEGENSYHIFAGDTKKKIYTVSEKSSNITRAGVCITAPSGKTSINRKGEMEVFFNLGGSSHWAIRMVNTTDALGNLIWEVQLPSREKPKKGESPTYVFVGQLIHNEIQEVLKIMDDSQQEVLICPYTKNTNEFQFKRIPPGGKAEKIGKDWQVAGEIKRSKKKPFFALGDADSFRVNYGASNPLSEKVLLSVSAVAIDFMFFEKIPVSALGTIAEKSQLSASSARKSIASGLGSG